MALTMVEEPLKEKSEVVEPPPHVVTTPCDPWPRPYYLEDGLRKVLPYHFTYNTYCKERWRGKEVLDIFATEFRDRPTSYYVGFLSHPLKPTDAL
jgi:tRNA pseudouridine synthase 9